MSPYSDLFGGAILNATISLSAYATIEPLAENRIMVTALDRNEGQQSLHEFDGKIGQCRHAGQNPWLILCMVDPFRPPGELQHW